MVKTVKNTLMLLSIIGLLTGIGYANPADPVGVIFQVKGTVEYSKDGDRWLQVRRNKFLFPGYLIRTGSDGSGTVTIQETGENTEVGPNALIQVSASGLQAKEGSLQSAEEASRLVSGLMQRFTRSQSYTTVRRSHAKPELKIDMAREIKLSDEHPDVVWANLGKEYEYRLTLGDHTITVPSTEDDFVRVKVEPFSGEKIVKIEVLQNGKVVTELEPYQSRGQRLNHKLVWMSADEKAEFQNAVHEIQKTYGEDSFMLGSYFENQNMWVAAMDQYRQYLAAYPDELEMAPFLFRVYRRLQLEDLYQRELEDWKTAQFED